LRGGIAILVTSACPFSFLTAENARVAETKELFNPEKLSGRLFNAPCAE
jgi:hypothetical protein